MPIMSLRPGEVFAGYTVDRELGAGGMGSVYLARHPRLPRYDALKLLRAELCTDPGFVGRFEREADTVAQLDHPNIVPVYDRGSQDGQLWISMRFIDGTNAEKAIADQGGGGLAPDRAVRIISKVASALDYAHKHELLHRDVKPANILLTPGPEDDDEAERVFLSDFGVAKAIGEAAERISSLTSTGSVVATLDYASPEQIKGQILDHRSDIYALGCVLYKLLTGTVPYPGDSVAARVYGHLNNDARPPSGIEPSLPAGFDEVVATAMAKDANDRYPTCRALALAARAALTSPSGTAEQPAAGPDAGFPTIMTTSAGVLAARRLAQQPGSPQPPSSPGQPQPGQQPGYGQPPGQQGQQPAQRPAEPMPPWLGAAQQSPSGRTGPGQTADYPLAAQSGTAPHTAREQADQSWPGGQQPWGPPGRQPPNDPSGNRPPPGDTGPQPASTGSVGAPGAASRRRMSIIAAATAAVLVIGGVTAFVLTRENVAGTGSAVVSTDATSAPDTTTEESTPATTEESITSEESSSEPTSSAITPPVGPIANLPHSDPLPEQVLLASRTENGSSGLFQFDATTQDMGQLLASGGGPQYPILSPDRGSVIYIQVGQEGKQLRTVAVDGSGDRVLLKKDQWPAGCTDIYRPAWNTANPSLITLSCEQADGTTVVHSITIEDGQDLGPLTFFGLPIVDDLTYSPDGTAIAFWGSESRAQGVEGTIFTVPADGSGGVTQLVDREDGTADADPTYSPDGSKIAFRRLVTGGGVDGGNSAHIYVVNTDGTELTQITDGTAIDQDPIWSPDGSQIAFKSNRPNAAGTADNQIFVMNADGSDVLELGIGRPGAGDGAPAWGHR